MRTIQQANQNKPAWDRKCWSRLEEYTKVQDDFNQEDFNQLDGQKTSGFSGPTTLNGGHQPLRKRNGDNSDLSLRPRQVVLQTGPLDDAKGSTGRSLVKINSLPPIYDSKVTTMHGGKTWVQRRLVDHEQPQTSKQANISTVSLGRDRTLAWRRREGGQLASTVGLICSSLAMFTVTKHTPEDEVRTLSQSAVNQSKKILGLGEKRVNHLSKYKSLLAKDSGVMTKGTKDSASLCETKQHTQPLSDSAIETETQSSHRNGGVKQEERTGVLDDQEEEYYTKQRIEEWIIRVNACLFSSSKDELSDVLLKEEDVDTIKIVYGED